MTAPSSADWGLPTFYVVLGKKKRLGTRSCYSHANVVTKEPMTDEDQDGLN